MLASDEPVGWPGTRRAVPTRLRQLPSVFAIAVAAICLGACGSTSKSSTVVSSDTTPVHGPGSGKPAVTIGTKNFTEQYILGQLYAQALRAKGYTVTVKGNIGASEVIDRALRSGTVDGYPEYTGTVLSTIAHDPKHPQSAEEAFARAKKFEAGRGIALLPMAPAVDTDVLATKPAYAAAHNLKSLQDLQRLGSSAILGAPPEFRTRFNGLVGLQQLYGVTNLKFQPLQIGTQYQALDSGRVQIAAVFTTDGQLSEGGYTLLADPRNIFGFQNVTFVVRQPVLEREGPAFAQTINAVTAKLSTQALRVMNASVDLDQQSPEAVARQFLAANGLT